MEPLKTDLVFIKFLARWVLKLLTVEHKFNRLTNFQCLLNFSRKEGVDVQLHPRKKTKEYETEISDISSQPELENSTIDRRI
jgi:hypothetical protein